MNAQKAGLVVMIAGSRWEDVRGTDHRFAEALSLHTPVLWVDPPVPIAGPASAGRPPVIPGYRLDGLRPDLLRLRATAPPGFTRPLVRALANQLLGRAIRRVLADLQAETVATIVLSPREVFPTGVPGKRVLYVTDDWPAGAGLMGLSRRGVEKILHQNIHGADLVAVVSPYLADVVASIGGPSPVSVVPNGCTIPKPSAAAEPGRRLVAVIVGQLNERLDLDLLDALAASGIDIEVIGPRRDRDPETSIGIDRFLAAENVRWLGEMTEAEVVPRLGTFAAGLTPYADTAFNRASFPIKTLDYLAAGLQVVATDLPAVRWLDTPWVSIAQNSVDFVEQLRSVLGNIPTGEDIAARQAFAGQHTWDSRARELLLLIGQAVA